MKFRHLKWRHAGEGVVVVVVVVGDVSVVRHQRL